MRPFLHHRESERTIQPHGRLELRVGEQDELPGAEITRPLEHPLGEGPGDPAPLPLRIQRSFSSTKRGRCARRFS